MARKIECVMGRVLGYIIFAALSDNLELCGRQIQGVVAILKEEKSKERAWLNSQVFQL